MKYLLYAIGILFVISLVSNIFQYSNKPQPIVKVDTVKATAIDTVVKKEYITINKIRAKIDTVYVNNQLVQVAVADTVINKDSNYVKVKYYFPPVNKFDVKLALHNKTIYRTDSIFIYKNITLQASKSFWDNFNYSLNIGFGEGLINKQFDVYYGIGISYNLKSLF